jgi:hypothetical protein
MFLIHVISMALRLFYGKDRVKIRRLEADRCEQVVGAGAKAEASFYGEPRSSKT